VASSAWSPDGSRIAYVAGPELPGVSGGDQAKADLMQRRIWVQSAAGGPATMLTDDPAYRDEHPQWGSNQCIVFARVNRDDELTLWFADLNNASVQQITDAFSFADPQTTWFGYYGHIAWDAMYDWWPAHGYDLADRADACNMP
jgi:Tol biopolymer transport system component